MKTNKFLTNLPDGSNAWHIKQMDIKQNFRALTWTFLEMQNAWSHLHFQTNSNNNFLRIKRPLYWWHHGSFTSLNEVFEHNCQKGSTQLQHLSNVVLIAFVETSLTKFCTKIYLHNDALLFFIYVFFFWRHFVLYCWSPFMAKQHIV